MINATLEEFPDYFRTLDGKLSKDEWSKGANWFRKRLLKILKTKE